MKEVMAKFKSDRLWAALLFVTLLISNAAFNIGISDDQLKQVMWVTISFIAGKSIRGSMAGGVIDLLAPQAFATLEAVVPDVGKVKKPEDVP